MTPDISAADSIVNSAAHGFGPRWQLGSLIMTTSKDLSRKAKPTPADIGAAARLKAIWDSRPRSLGLSQEKMGEVLGISQGAVSQYINGQIPLNFRTVVLFAQELGVEPRQIRDDLPEIQSISQPEGAQSSGSHSAGLNVEKLADLLETVEAAIAQSGRQVPVRTKARLVAALYGDEQASAAGSAQAVQAALASILATLEQA